ncbi:hypothetical protein BK049_15255 [Bacillus xiamenensis]|uniref:Uncharacterized protein n=1 Tax=Bacillus xiamenensis TaxID=1178537 RepID=A0AAC9IJQ1_9BACI|nr:YxiJ family protein [Bacillus xiamenensis]AOZ89927.1 hypothetical protein BK049_15255 [Bacillus xiamenensis]
MKISGDKQGLFDELKTRYQYLLDSSYPDDIVSFEEDTVIWSDNFIYCTCCGSSSLVIDHKRIPKKQLNFMVERKSFEIK